MDQQCVLVLQYYIHDHCLFQSNIQLRRRGMLTNDNEIHWFVFRVACLFRCIPRRSLSTSFRQYWAACCRQWRPCLLHCTFWRSWAFIKSKSNKVTWLQLISIYLLTENLICSPINHPHGRQNSIFIARMRTFYFIFMTTVFTAITLLPYRFLNIYRIAYEDSEQRDCGSLLFYWILNFMVMLNSVSIASINCC